MPVDATILKDLLERSDYDPVKSEYLVKGFTEGFDIEYQGETKVWRFSDNLKLDVSRD